MTEKIYRLSLEWKPLAHIPDRFSLETKLDDTLLIDLVREWELEHVPEQEKKLAGDYAGLFHYYSHWLVLWLNEPFFDDVPAGDEPASVLGCTCGELGCWPLETAVTLTDQHAIWSNFAQQHRRGSWTYDGFGPFTFHRAQYEAEVRRAIAQAPA